MTPPLFPLNVNMFHGPLASHKIRPSFCAIILFSTCMRLREEMALAGAGAV